MVIVSTGLEFLTPCSLRVERAIRTVLSSLTRYLYMPIELSLDFIPLFLSNYPQHTQYLICMSEPNQSSAQMWASLVHFKSRY